MDSGFVNYCSECTWSASTDQYTRGELSTLTVEHACETGHDVRGERLENDREDRSDGGQQQDATGTNEEAPSRLDGTTGEYERVYSVSERYRSDGKGSTNERDNGWGRRDDTSGALTRGDFEAELRRLLGHAHRSGLAIGGCDIRFPDRAIPDYAIEIYELRDE